MHQKKRLINLFSACGVASNFSIDPTLDIELTTNNLRDFLDHGIFAARDAFQLQAENSAQINKMIADLERLSGVRLVLEDSSFPHTDNMQVLEKFQKLTDRMLISGLYRELAGIDIELGAITYIEDGSNVTLSRTDSADEWYSFLEKQDWKKIEADRLFSWKVASDRQQLLDKQEYEKNEKEKQIAALLGALCFDRSYFDKFEAQLSVDKIPGLEFDGSDDYMSQETADEIRNSESNFLDKILSNKGIFRDLKKDVKKKLKNLHLSYAANMPDGVKYHLSPLGDLQISTKIKLKEFVDILQTHGPRAVELAREEAHWEHIRDYVEVRLGLKQLTADKMFYFTETEAVQKARSALKRLHDSVDSIKTHLLSGLTLAISNHYGISRNGVIYLKWDFKSDELLFLERPKEPINEST